MNSESEIRPFYGKYFILKTGYSNIINVDATIKKLMVIQGEIGSSPGEACFVQSFSIVPVISERQILAALEHTISAFMDGTQIVGQIQLEFLLRLSATRELKKALGLCGLKEGKQQAALIAVAGNEDDCASLYSEAAQILDFNADSKIMDTNFEANKGKICLAYGIPEWALAEKGSEKAVAESFAIESIALLSLEE